MRKSIIIPLSLILIILIVSLSIMKHNNSKVRPHMRNNAYKYYETLNNFFISEVVIDKDFEDKLNRFITNYERVELTKKENLILEELKNLHADYVMCEFYKKENDINNLNRTIESFKANSEKFKVYLKNSPLLLN